MMIKAKFRIFAIAIAVIMIPGIVSAGQFKVTQVYHDCSFRASMNNTEIKFRLVGIEIPEESIQKRASGRSIPEQAGSF